jgi:hypothetical protein
MWGEVESYLTFPRGGNETCMVEENWSFKSRKRRTKTKRMDRAIGDPREHRIGSRTGPAIRKLGQKVVRSRMSRKSMPGRSLGPPASAKLAVEHQRTGAAALYDRKATIAKQGASSHG